MTEKKKRQPTLAGETKTQVVALLKEHYPDFFKHFRFQTRSWSTGGAVDIIWTDGPSRDEIKALIEPMNDRTTIYISPERHFTIFLLTRIAKEVCQREGWELPKIDCTEEGHAYVTHLCLNHIYTGIYHEAYKTSTLAEEEK